MTANERTHHAGSDKLTVGLITAMDVELEAILRRAADAETVTAARHRFHRWTVGHAEVVATVGGIGKVQAAAVTQILLDHFNPRFIINSGVAGALKPALPHNTIVLGERLGYHDFDLARFVPERHPLRSDPRLVELAVRVHAEQASGDGEASDDNGGKSPELRRGTVVSGDVFVDSAAARDRIAAASHADAVDMESAAIAQVAAAQATPVLIIRTISDQADEEAAHEDWDAWAATAAEHAAALCLGVVGRLAEGTGGAPAP